MLAERLERDDVERPLVGAVVGDSVRYVIASAVVILLGLIVVFTFSLSWVFTVVGLVMRAPNAVMNTGFMALFPLVFLSNIFVEPETLPGWLEWFVGVNPISYLVSATRGLCLLYTSPSPRDRS